jgi:hypothetical protein
VKDPVQEVWDWFRGRLDEPVQEVLVEVLSAPLSRKLAGVTAV